jgi:hypothetical protein
VCFVADDTVDRHAAFEAVQELKSGTGEEVKLSFGLKWMGGAKAPHTLPGSDGSASIIFQPQHKGSGDTFLGPGGAQQRLLVEKVRHLDSF